MSEEQEFKKPFIIEEFDLSNCGSIQVDIVAYRGKLLDPLWVDIERGEFVVNLVVARRSAAYRTFRLERYLHDIVFRVCGHVKARWKHAAPSTF